MQQSSIRWMVASSLMTTALMAVGLTNAGAQGRAAKVEIEYQDPILNARYPELLYWFVTPETLKNGQYARDIEHIAHDTTFDFPILTAREGVNFTTRDAHDGVAKIVALGHKNGLRIGATLHVQDTASDRPYPPEDQQTVVSDGEGTLDANGHAVLTTSIKLRSAAPQRTELLRVYVFRKSGDGTYDPATLSDVTSQAKPTSTAPGTLAVTLDLGASLAGETAFVMAETWFNTLDMFSDSYLKLVHSAIDQYRDVAFYGTALDEFGYIRVPIKPATPYRGQFAGRAFRAGFESSTGMDLTRTLFDTRYAPTDRPEVRIRAIDAYWDFLRKGPLRIEREFFDYSRQVFGPTNFAGIHDTFHNHLTNDEAWATGIDWWTIPRQYGMSDEDLSLPLRMGLLVAHPGNIMYDQFYGFDIPRFASKAMNDARFDARLHYHGYNDTGRWGADLSKQTFLMPVERKIRLLNQFDPAAPRLPLLIVFGMPALLNWYPYEQARNEFDINGSLHIEEKVQEVWDAGYRCAVVPSELIDDGSLTLDAQNHPVLHGHTFRAVIYLDPQYAKRSTLDFFDRFTRRGGALMLEGEATRDFNGQPVGTLFQRIEARARVKHFSVANIPSLGVQVSPLAASGGELEDGSIILTDLPSLQSGKPKLFAVDVNGHRFSGDYVGVFALKAGANGALEKLACGGCSLLERDGHRLLMLQQRADLVLTRSPDGSYHAVLEGKLGSNSLTLLR
jgi:hypothetical protein